MSEITLLISRPVSFVWLSAHLFMLPEQLIPHFYSYQRHAYEWIGFEGVALGCMMHYWGREYIVVDVFESMAR